MTPGSESNDLVVLVADKNMKHAVNGLLLRTASLRIRSISKDVFDHPNRDAGCFKEGDKFLRDFTTHYDHAIIMFDREGCGQESLSREELERQVEDNLSRSGWGNRAAGIVVDPELEAWIWSDSPHVTTALGWSGRNEEVRGWLREQGFAFNVSRKPDRPKEALERALEEVRKPRSSSIYAQLARRVSLNRCNDSAFKKFK